MESELFCIKTKSFAQMRKVQKNSKIILYQYLDLFKLLLKEKRTIEMGLIIAVHPEGFFGQNENEWNYLEKNIIFHSNVLLTSLINETSYLKLDQVISQYLKIFSQWKKLDYHQTIKGIIISYHYRMKHLGKIRKDKIEEEQKLVIIKQLLQQIKHLEESLIMMNKNFNLEDLKQNHHKYFDKYVKVTKQTVNIMSKAYLDYLIENCQKGNWKPLYNEIISTQNRALELVPKKRKESVKKKFNSYSDVILDLNYQQWNEKLLEMILFLTDLMINLDAPINDKENENWKIETLSMVEKPFIEGISNLFIKINQKIDSIHLLIKNLN